jgi:hypothetical protein
MVLTTLQIRCHVQLHRTLDVGCLASQGSFRLCRFGYPVGLFQHMTPQKLTNISGTVLAWFIMPESSYRSSAEIHEMFVDRVPLRKWKTYKTSVERNMELRQMGEVA